MVSSTINGASAEVALTDDEDDFCPIRRSPAVGCVSYLSIRLSSLFVFILLTISIMAQEDSVAKEAGVDSVVKEAGVDSVVKEAGVDSVVKKAGVDSVVKKAGADSVVKKTASDKSEQVNIILGNKKVRAYGWGEYRVGGRCLCCDNMNDGDCIVVHTIERTNRERISQIVDGKTEGDTGDVKTYFGDLRKRDLPEPVNSLMIEISFGKLYEVRKVVVYPVVDKKKLSGFLSNCELGYYNQFNKWKWTGKVKSKKYNEPITFEMENPVATKAIMLRVKGGKSRITEVAVFCDKRKE